MKINTTRFLLFAVLISSAPCAHPVTIAYTAADLANVSPGSDLWRYSYQVSGFTFGAGQGFTVFFAPTLFRNLQSPPPPPNGLWDTISVQPDLGLNSSGFCDGLALANGASLANPFTIEFVWLGTGTPGSQPYTIYDTDFSTVSQGQTTPEPSSAVLLWTAGGALCVRRKRRRA